MAMETCKPLPPRYVAARPNDYLYDPIFSVSGARDFQKVAMTAAMNTAEFRVRPNFLSMFSELVQFPHAHLALVQGSDRLPKFIDKSWHGRTRAEKITVTKPVDVEGTDRHRYFRRPLIPFRSVVPELILSPTHHESGKDDDVPFRLKKRNRGQQTKYRESSAQTSPWEPPYKVKGEGQPEVLTLANLSWGFGLPAGMHECRIIERARVRVAWERGLPPVTDEATLDLRRKVITQLESDDWAFRESEIDDIQHLRMEVMLKIMQQAYHNISERAMKKLQNYWYLKQAQKDHKIAQIRHETCRALRQLDMKHRGIKAKYQHVNVVDEHINYHSELYGPMLRHGEHPKRFHQVLAKSKDYTPEFLGVTKMSTLPRWLHQFDAPPNRLAGHKGPLPRHLCARETKWNKAKLGLLHAELKKLRLNRYKKAQPLSLRVRIIRPETPPETPSVDAISDRDEEMHQAALYLQKIVRGRAAQSLIYEGRDRNRELIEELKSTHALQEADMILRNAERVDIMMQQRTRCIQLRNAEKVDEILRYLEGSTLGTTLDYLNKELLRLQDERRAHAFALMAMRERWKREAAEAGRRQKEERRRREHDEMFKQVVKIHQETVDLYLEDIILEGMQRRADNEARQYVKNVADTIENAAEYAASDDFLQQQELTADLIHNFVLPEVEKQIVRTNLRKKQEKYLLTAHNAIYDEIPQLPRIIYPSSETVAEPMGEEETQQPETLSDIDILRHQLLDDIQFALDRALSDLVAGSSYHGEGCALDVTQELRELDQSIDDTMTSDTFPTD